MRYLKTDKRFPFFREELTLIGIARKPISFVSGLVNELLETHSMVLFQGLAGHAYSMDRAESDAALAVLAQLRAYYRGIILRY